MLSAPTMLKPQHYIQGGIVGAAYRTRLKCPVHFYHFKKQCWAGVRHFGENCKVSREHPGPYVSLNSLPLVCADLSAGAWLTWS